MAQWRAEQRAQPGYQSSKAAYARQPFQRPVAVLHRPPPTHRTAPAFAESPRHRQPPTFASTTRWAHPRLRLDVDDLGRPLDVRKFRKMLLETGIDIAERDLANFLHDARVNKDTRAPSLDLAQLLESLFLTHSTMEAGTSPYPRPPDYCGEPAHNLPFAVPRRVRMIFDAIDKDQSGYLEDLEIIEALKRYGIDATCGRPMMVVQEAAGMDGRLDFEEFATLVAQLEDEKRRARQLRHVTASLTPRAPHSPRFL